MAKSRKKARKSASSRKAPAKRRGTRRAPSPRKPKAVELRPIRTKLRSDVALLQSAPSTDKVRDAIDRLNRCLAEIDEICGPDMMIPLE